MESAYHGIGCSPNENEFRRRDAEEDEKGSKKWHPGFTARDAKK
jgi:hypothetical protein